MSSDRKRRIWTYLDELESLDHLATLNDALTKGRKKGLCVATGFQSYAQVEQVYGDKKAETILGNHRSVVTLAVGRMGTSTAKKMSDAMGQHEIKRRKEGSSARWGQFVGTRSENEDVKPENIVMPAEIMALPDLEGFLSFPGSIPIARVKFEPVNYVRKTPVPGIIRPDMTADFVC
jgi:type IV secretory pathway TraG/TraD family ATPase VirD4